MFRHLENTNEWADTMKMYDVTGTVYEGMTVYKDKPEKQPTLNSVTNGYVTETRIALDVHTGTHIDAPRHMVIDGDTFESVPIEDLVGQSKVFDLTEVEDGISKKDLAQFDIQKGDFIILKTKNSYEESNAFNFDFIYLAQDGAEYLSELVLEVLELTHSVSNGVKKDIRLIKHYLQIK